MALISDTSWISDGSLIPDTLPASFTPIFVGIEYDAAGVETGIMFETPAVTFEEAVQSPSIGPAGLGVLVAVCVLAGVHLLPRNKTAANPSELSQPRTEAVRQHLGSSPRTHCVRGGLSQHRCAEQASALFVRPAAKNTMSNRRPGRRKPGSVKHLVIESRLRPETNVSTGPVS